MLKSEELSDEASYFCNTCSAHKTAYVEHTFSKLGQYLIVQIKCFDQQKSAFRKNIQKVVCAPNITVPVVDNELTAELNFKLLGTVKHTGTLDRGHYTVFIKQRASKNWLFCNDSAVLSSV